MSFEDFVAAAWTDHGDRPAEVAARLEASVALVGLPEQVEPFARLVTHVHGEHLARWEEGLALLTALCDLPVCHSGSEATAAVQRGIAALRHGRGDSGALDALGVDDRATVLATTTAACAAQGRWSCALADFAAALACAEAGLSPQSPALRALAVAGNNLAVALEEKPDRSPAETRGMVTAAQAGVTYWRLAGTWLEEERAHYRLAQSLLAAGEVAAARESAARCAALCAEHDAPAFERFFAAASVAATARRAQDTAAFATARDEALAWYAQVAEDERAWCSADLAALESDPASTG